MPEGGEIEAHELNEKLTEIHEAHHDAHLKGEHEDAHWLRWVSLTTGLLAVIAAIAALLSGSLVNEGLDERNMAVLMQEQASDEWAYYQAKGIKGNAAGQTAEILTALPNAQLPRAEHYKAEAEQYKRDQAALLTKAQELEKERDEKLKGSNALMHRHHTFAYSVTFTQIAIALSAIAALMRRKQVWYISLAAGAVGLVFFIMGFLPVGH
jgi:hypothetical protein